MLNVRRFILRLLFGKEGDTMLAMLWAQEIMNCETVEAAKAMYARVPRLLKDKVKEILIASGMEHLVTE